MVMDLNEHKKPENLLKYAFYYNEARLVLAGITLLIGKMSPVLIYFYIPVITVLAALLMSIAWILAGVAAAYLLYLWFKAEKKLWGEDNPTDRAAFAIAIISGLHLGWAGLTGTNIGFAILPFLGLVMPLAGLLYLWSAFHLGKRFKANPNMFGQPKTPEDKIEPQPEQPTETMNQ